MAFERDSLNTAGLLLQVPQKQALKCSAKDAIALMQFY
jgi:hypothetical protein